MQKLHSFIQEQVLKHDVDLLSLLDWIKVKRIDSCWMNWFDVLIFAEL